MNYSSDYWEESWCSYQTAVMSSNTNADKQRHNHYNLEIICWQPGIYWLFTANQILWWLVIFREHTTLSLTAVLEVGFMPRMLGNDGLASTSASFHICHRTMEEMNLIHSYNLYWVAITSYWENVQMELYVWRRFVLLVFGRRPLAAHSRTHKINPVTTNERGFLLAVNS